MADPESGIAWAATKPRKEHGGNLPLRVAVEANGQETPGSHASDRSGHPREAPLALHLSRRRATGGAAMSWHWPPRHRIAARTPIERRGAARAAVRRVEDQQPATARRTLRETRAELHARRFGDAGDFCAALKACAGPLLRTGVLL